ncbi:MAG TPA: VWA domain-containing protein [Pyrinomonadaceae bacterium]|nr:VWA domain-containing protein [Pyrinomonadaceae bacterium]
MLSRALVSALSGLMISAPPALAQQPRTTERQDQTEVLRVTTELVQTDVMVFDRQGRFVDDLTREQFELRINGKLKPVEFFERVIAGSPNEERQLAAARGSANGRSDAGGAGAASAAAAVPLDRGRPVFFFVDDLHLDQSSIVRTRQLLTKFVDNEMGQNDEAAIASASGQIGFLQQLTDNKTVLRAAVAKLNFRPYTIRDFERPAMSEYQALRVEGYDRDITDYLVEETMKNNPGITPAAAEAMVQGRARSLLAQAARVTGDSLAGLEGLVKSAKSLPGRKLVFFISDGFFLDVKNSDSYGKLQRITSLAAKSGVVIYSIDARGLVASLTDASSPSQFDPTGRVLRSSMGELSASQDAMNALAADTGGKAFFNSNALEPHVKRALKETATYYLLAWKPDLETKENRKFNRIEVKVIGRSGVTLQVRRGFFDLEPERVASASKRTDKQAPPASPPQSELGKVMSKPFQEREIPIALSLNFLNVPEKGSMLSATMQVPREFFSFEPVNGKPTAVVDVAGTFFNAKGQPGASFSNRITVTPPPAGQKEQDLAYGHPVVLTPGLYHVRVAARDEKSGKAGSAHGWIEIPDLSKGQLALSSVLMGGRPATEAASASSSQELQNSVGMSVNNRFSSRDYLRFIIFAYNARASSSDAKPDVAIQLQILRDEQPVVTTPLKKMTVDASTDLARIPYAAEVSLAGLPAGRYLLRLTAVDRVSKTTASQQARFEIE